jgi:hypothetical protein
MDTGDLRRRILRALDDARKDATSRRQEKDEAAAAFERFLTIVAIPIFRQAVDVLRAQGHRFEAQTPAGSVRLADDHHQDSYIEIELDRSGARPQVLGRVSVSGRRGPVVEEHPLAPTKAIGEITDEDLAAYLVREIPRLLVR